MSSGRLYDRIARVTIYRPGGEGFFGAPGPNAIVIECHPDTGLRAAFSVEKGIDSSPNKCEITISNLAQSTRGAIAKLRPMAVVLEAGYDRKPRRLFFGDVRWADSRKDGPTWNTVLLVGDGDRAFRFARVSRSYRAGANVRDAIRDAAAAMGLKPPAELEISEELAEQFSGGDTLFGNARDELSRLLGPYGYEWSIQDGRLVILRSDQVRPGEAWPLDQTTGMKDSPELAPPDKSGKPSKLTAHAALYPEISPGGVVRLKSRRISGNFKVESVKHTGDTEGDDWDTEIECKIRAGNATGNDTGGGNRFGGGRTSGGGTSATL